VNSSDFHLHLPLNRVEIGIDPKKGVMSNLNITAEFYSAAVDPTHHHVKAELNYTQTQQQLIQLTINYQSLCHH
jgi:hypothetical protein